MNLLALILTAIVGALRQAKLSTEASMPLARKLQSNLGSATLRPMTWGRFSGAAVVIVAATILMVPAFVAGHIIGHSSLLNVVWSEGFAERLFSGEVYPRWLPAMSQGAGSPVFYFYAPLPFYLVAPFHLVAEARFAVVLGSWLILALSGLSFLALARAFVRPGPAILAAIVYMAMPYHLLADVWIRAALGEQAAFAFMPICLLCAVRLGDGRSYMFGLAASFAGLLLSHLPSALVFTPFLVGFCLWTAWRGDALAIILRGAIAALLSGGLAAAYIIPAILLQDMIHADYWSIYRPQENFLFGGNGLAFSKFLEFAFVSTAFVVVWATIAVTAAGRGWLIAPWAVVAAAVGFIATPASAWVWDLSMLDRVQFPWRALTLFDIAASMMLALAFDTRIRGWRIVAQIMGATIVVMTGLFLIGRGLVGSYPASLSRPTAIENARIAARADAPEYLPSCRPLTDSEVVDGTSAQIVARGLREAGDGVLPVFHYPFLTVIVDGVSVPTSCDPATGFTIANVPETATVEVRKISLPVERTGYAISIFSLVILALGILALGLPRKRAIVPAADPV